MSACFGRKHALGVNTTGVNGDDVTSVTFNANACVQRRCCTQNYHRQCRKSRETYIECMHIFAYNQQRAVLKSAACRLQAAGLYQNRRPHISVQEKKLALPGHCGFDSYSNKDAMSFVTWKTIPKQLGEFVLIFLPSRHCAEFSESPVN